MKIGELAKRSDVNIDTVRYYERLEMIPKPERRESGYREFGSDTVQRIRFIRHAQELGFTLKEIKELLSLRVKRTTTCSDIKKRTDVKIIVIEEKIALLSRMKKTLNKLSRSCNLGQSTDDCPILGAMDAEKSII